MPLFLVKRTFAEQVDLSDDQIRALEITNDEFGVRWIESFLSADRLQSYCLFEAPSADRLRAASASGGMPIDAIIEVNAALGALAEAGR
jgi:Nickel responsive protein SCO4226-like